MRTDANNNPTAFTTAIAYEAGLLLGADYEQGDSFTIDGATYYTARLLRDPLVATIKVIDILGFRAKSGQSRWIYINFPHFVWVSLGDSSKIDVIGWMYQQEGGVAMRHLFPNYGKA
jgi:hypothetical protein